jgi:hypothetical protein
VLFHKAVQGALSVDPDALATIRGLKHDFGWNLLGNLLDLGGLAFAPDTPEVHAFVAHMRESHQYFDELFQGVFKSEVRAWKGGARGVRSAGRLIRPGDRWVARHVIAGAGCPCWRRPLAADHPAVWHRSERWLVGGHSLWAHQPGAVAARPGPAARPTPLPPPRPSSPPAAASRCRRRWRRWRVRAAPCGRA